MNVGLSVCIKDNIYVVNYYEFINYNYCCRLYCIEYEPKWLDYDGFSIFVIFFLINEWVPACSLTI